MINKELELTINNQKILERLADNLNITYIGDNSAIKKLSDSFLTELSTYSNATESAIRNGFISSMDDDLLEQFAASFGIYRKKYSSLVFASNEKVATLTTNTTMAFNKNYQNFKPFLKGSILYEDSGFTIKTLSDITFANIYDNVFPSIEINITSETPISIPEGSVLILSTNDTDVSKIVPTYELAFNYTVGMSLLEESIEDFRLRIYEHTYMSSSYSNSLLHFIAKEIPILKHIETDSIEKGRAVEVLYPYTQYLIDHGEDTSINSFIIPTIDSVINSRGVFKSLIKVKQPRAVKINIKLKNIPTDFSQSYLDNVRTEFNNLMVYTKNIDLVEAKNFIVNKLNLYSISDVELYYTNTSLTVEDILLVDDKLELGIGKFIYLSGIEVS